MDELKKKYPHLLFRKQWKITPEIYYMLGECNSFIKSITNTAISPEYLESLHKVSLIKGAQATTAIEGNTLSIEDIKKIQAGEKLSPSKEYLQIEVQNIIEAFNVILKEVIFDKKIELISDSLIKKYHKMVGLNLGDHFESIPGEFRSNQVVVGNYRAPEKKDVKELVNKLCDWLQIEFNFGKNQTFIEAVIQAIVTHIYVAWIHPFSDGNGRTARLLEYYLLLRAGVPDIASHVLSNFYNITRSEYYRQIQNATAKKDLTYFIKYAVQGFRDGLHEVLDTIQENQLLITWTNYIYGIFEDKMSVGKTREANKRRRNLLLEIPYDRFVDIEEIQIMKPWIIKEYAALSERSFQRDIEELLKLNLLVKEDKKYRVKIEILKKFMAAKLKE